MFTAIEMLELNCIWNFIVRIMSISQTLKIQKQLKYV
jgi:hypothetical protein